MKKITFLLIMLITSLGFSQTPLASTGEDPNAELFGNSAIQGQRAACDISNPLTAIVDGWPTTPGIIIADDFAIAANENFEPSSFTFNYLNQNPNTLISIDVSIHVDAAGLPGAAIYSFPAQVPVSQTVVGSAFGRDAIDAEFDLSGAGIVLSGGAAGTTYWVALTNAVSTVLGGDNTAYWSNVPLANGSVGQFSTNGGASWGATSGDHAFVMSGQCLAVVAECGNAPLPIPASGTTGPMDPSIATVATVGVIGVAPGEFTLDSVELNLNHTFDADLDISLTSPNGIVLNLSDDNGGAGDDYIDTVFTDGAPNITTGAPPFTGMFEPEGGTLNGTFAGEPVNGDWTLNIFDDVGGDSGTLNSYCINFTEIGVIGNAPVIACPLDINIDTTAGLCEGVANWNTPVAIDVEDGPIVATHVSGPMSGDALAPGPYVVTYSVTDSDGNIVTCSFNITVTDNEAPVAACMDISVDLDANGLATITPNDIDNASSDNCGIVSYAFAGQPGAPATLNVSFAAGNGQAGNMFDVVGLNPVVINSFDINSQQAAGTLVDFEVYFKTGTWVGSDMTAGDWTLVGTVIDVPSAGPGVGTPLGLGLGINVAAGETVAFYVTATDGSGVFYTNGGTVGDVWASDANLEVLEGAGKVYPFLNTFQPRNFNGNIIYETGAIPPFGGTFDCSNVGANTVLLEVTDAQGNSSTCTAVVTVSDVTAPDIVCIGEQLVGPNTVADAPGTVIVDNTTVSTTINVADDYAITDLNVDMNITHTWTGDLQITLESPAGTQVLIFDGGSDGCSGDNINDIYDDESANTLNCQAGTGNAFPEDDYIPSNALSAFDGESSMGVWTLFVEDTAGGDAGTIDSWALIYDFAPIVATPYTATLDANGMVTVNAADLLLSVDEACGWTATVGGAPAPATLFTTLDGGNGNFGNMFDVNALEDVTIDSFDIHGDTGATFDVEVYAKLGTYVGFETDPASWTLIGTAPGVVSNGDGVVTPLNLALNYAMASGETHAFYVTPTDFSTGGFNYTNGTAVGAVFAADANLEFLEGSGSGYPFDGTLFSPRVFNGNIQYSAGGGISTTIDLDCSNLGENLIEVTVTDASGNASMCTATVIVEDVTDPILVCADATIELGPDGTAVVDPLALLANMPGTINVLVIGSDNQSGTEGLTDITVPVTADVTVSFDWDYVLNDVPGFDSFGYLLNGVYTQLTDPAIGDQSGSESVALVTGDVFGFRSQTDDNIFGNNETVITNFMPGFTGQFDPANWTETLTNSDGSATFVEIPGGPLSFDACGITILAVDITEVTCADIGTPITVTVFASDASMNIASCTSVVTVVDNLAPVVTCPPDQTVDPGPNNLFYEVPDYYATGEATAVDNCTDPLTILSQDPAPGSLIPDGVYTVTMTAEDEYGNVGTCTFELTVESVLGLDDNELDVAISMYPNPAESQVTITNSSNIELERAAIYDMNGKLIQEVDLSQMTGEQVIDVSYLSAGVYVVQITSDDSSAIKRLIKE